MRCSFQLRRAVSTRGPRCMFQSRHAYATKASYDVAIVGAGVMGSSIAFELGKKGWSTLNVDASSAAGHGSTGASCGIIRTMYTSLDNVKLAYEGWHLWKQWEEHLAGTDELGPAFYQDAMGVIINCEAATAFLQAGKSHHDLLRIPYEEVDSLELKKRFPWMDVTSYGPAVPHDSPDFGSTDGKTVSGAMLNPTTGYVSDTVLASHNLQRAAEAVGGHFRFGVKVQAVRKSHGRVSGVTLSDGSVVDARVVVNAAGPWSADLNKLAFQADDIPEDDSTVKTRPMRVEVAYPPAPSELGASRDMVWVGDFDTGVYFRSATGGRLCIGSVEPPCDTQHDLHTPDEFEEGFSEAWERQVYRAALRIPTLPVPNVAQGVSHMYDKSDDFVPIYDKSSLPGYYTAIGTSGNQFKNCGVVGQLMAHLIETCENGHNHDKDPVRFALPLSGHTLNLRTFSRLRARESTSQGVLG